MPAVAAVHSSCSQIRNDAAISIQGGFDICMEEAEERVSNLQVAVAVISQSGSGCHFTKRQANISKGLREVRSQSDVPWLCATCHLCSMLLLVCLNRPAACHCQAGWKLGVARCSERWLPP